jgi:tetratricopeptide (TPR) repeat protein
LEARAKVAFAQANEAYRAKDFSRAARLYKDIATSGVVSAELYYNLGTTLAQLGKTGEAVAYLKKAERLAPRDPDIRANLNMISQAAGASPPFILFVPFVAMRDAFSFREWAWIFVGVHVLAMGIWSWLVWQRGRVRIARALALATAALYLVVLAFAGWSMYETQFRKIVVVTAPEAPVYSGPSPRFTRLMTAKEGMILDAVDYGEQGWLRVELPTGQTGFVSSAQAMEI